MVLHNPNNWHWVNKDVSEWARKWLDDNLTTIEVEENGVKVKIAKITSMDGDCDVSQRKGKVITLFDLKLQLDYEGSAIPPPAPWYSVLTRWLGATSETSDKTTGSITIPEVAHDSEESDYQFEIDGSNQAVKDVVRRSLLPKLRSTLTQLAPALIKEHGKDIQHAPGSGPPTGYIPTKTTSSTAAQSLGKSSSTATSSGANGAARINTVKLSLTEEMRTSSEELFTTFTDPGRITAFTRSPPTTFEGAKPGGKFAFFGGGVTGEYVTLQKPTKIVQKWRLAQWPAGHYSNLTLDFDQDDVNSVTNMRVSWDAVPVGEEDSTRGRFQEYYVRSLKTTFGFGTIL